MDLDYCFIKKSEKSSHLRMIGISFFTQAFCNERDLETQQNASVCRCSVFSFLLGTIVKFKVKDYYPVTQVSIFFSKKNGGRLILQMLLAQKHTRSYDKRQQM